MNPLVTKAVEELNDILLEHQDLLGEAKGFGMRTAALPKGLMPLKEAQEIVSKFDDNTKRLIDFLESLGNSVMRAPDKASKDALEEIYQRGAKSLNKFEEDLRKAKEALLKHEDLLVGENFQDMFQAIRLAILDLDLSSSSEFKAKTEMRLDANPAYATGLITISYMLNAKMVDAFRIRATYKAENDEYIADMWSEKSNRWFPAASKVGHARLPAFVRTIVDKLKVIHDLEHENSPIFGSRKKIENISPDLENYKKELAEKDLRKKMEAKKVRLNQTVSEISQDLVKKLKQRFPKARGISVAGNTQDKGSALTTWITIDLGTSQIQIANIFTYDSYSLSEKIYGLRGSYGILGSAENKLTNSIPPTENTNTYISAAVEEISKFAALDPAVNMALKKKIEAFVDALAKAEPSLRTTLSKIEEAKDVVAAHYTYLRGYYRLPIVVEAKKDARTFKVGVQNEVLEGQGAKLIPKIIALVQKVGVTRYAGTNRTAGSSEFTNIVWESNVRAAFSTARREALEEHGHGEGYSGTIYNKSSYKIRREDPLSVKEAQSFVEKDIDKNNKWDSEAFAIPLSRGTVLSTEKVTVTVTAKDEPEARLQATRRIYATGRFPPNADVVVSDPTAKKISETPRTKTFEITGTRKVVMTGKIDGWMFYGWSAS